jgi:hypothetical protein
MKQKNKKKSKSAVTETALASEIPDRRIGIRTVRKWRIAAATLPQMGIGYARTRVSASVLTQIEASLSFVHQTNIEI